MKPRKLIQRFGHCPGEKFRGPETGAGVRVAGIRNRSNGQTHLGERSREVS